MSTPAELLERFRAIESQHKELKKELAKVEDDLYVASHTVLHDMESGFYATLAGWISAGVIPEHIDRMELTDLTNDEALIKNAENAKVCKTGGR